jgi:hypothetical protein
MPRFERGGRGFDSLRGRQNYEPSIETISCIRTVGRRCFECGADSLRRAAVTKRLADGRTELIV